MPSRLQPILRRIFPQQANRLSSLHNESGAALIELAFTMSLLGLPLMMGTVHFSTLLIDSIVVSNCAHAGAEYGMTGIAYANDTAGITTAAQEDASGLGVTPTITPTIFYACNTAIGGTQYSTETAATTACTGTNIHPLEFVKVVASATVTPILNFPGASKTVALSSTSIMEVEE